MGLTLQSDFDLQALYDALDAERRARDLTWAALTAQVNRWDTKALHAALDARRRERGMTWGELAGELRGFTPNMLTNLASGPRIGFPRVMRLVRWLDQPAVDFTRIANW